MCCIGIENHSLLTNLYFTVSEVANALVNMQHCPHRVHFGFDKTETARDCAFAKQALTNTENYRELSDA